MRKMMNIPSDVKLENLYKESQNLLNPSGGKSAWGLEIGDKELKAAKVKFHNGELLVEAIDRIEYSTISQGIVLEKHELIEKAVNVFKERNLISGSDKVIASISGRSHFGPKVDKIKKELEKAGR